MIAERAEVNVSYGLFNQLGVGQNIQRLFFGSYYSKPNGRICFDYLENGERVGLEMVSLSKIYTVCGAGMWQFGYDSPTKVFLFFSALEAMCFAQLYQWQYREFSKCRFYSLGSCPNENQIKAISKKHMGASFYTIFGNTIIGKLYDCKIAAWLAGKVLRVAGNSNGDLVFTQGKQTSTIEPDQVSYNRYLKAFGGRAVLKTIKPKLQCPDFHTVLLNGRR